MLDAEFSVARRDGPVVMSLSVAPGRRLGVFGPSGAGKTTALEVLAGLVVPDEGTVSLDGRLLTQVGKGRPEVLVAPHERNIGLIRQNPALFPHLSIRENLSYARRAVDPQVLDRLIDRLELEPLLSSRPQQLSGGEAQRVAIARTLAKADRALLLDEPFNGLDARLRSEFTRLLDELLAPSDIPVVLVAHELELVLEFCDDLMILDHGAMLATGEVSHVLREPPTMQLAQLLGFTDFVAVARMGRIGIRGDHCLAGAEPARGCVLTVHVLRVRDVGVGYRYHVRSSDQEFDVMLPMGTWEVGSDQELTILDPPVFGDDGRCIGRWQTVHGDWEVAREG